MDAPVKKGRPRLVRLSRRGRPRQIRPAALHGVLVGHLREMIQNGELAPGEPIVEMDLSEQFGVSRTPLREALKVLSSEGLVDLRPHRTPVVAPVDPEEIAAIFEILVTLESLAGRRACENMTSEDLSDLETLHTAMVARHDTNDRAGYAAINRGIHARIVEMARNAPLRTVYMAFGIKIQRARSTTNYDSRRWLESIAEHEKIMAAFRRRSPVEVADALADHTQRTGAAVTATLNRVHDASQEVLAGQ